MIAPGETRNPEISVSSNLAPITFAHGKSKSGRERAYALEQREGLTLRQVAQRLGGFGGPCIFGTAKTIADEMEDWFTSGACDGFTVMFPYLPAGLDDSVNQVVPEL